MKSQRNREGSQVIIVAGKNAHKKRAQEKLKSSNFKTKGNKIATKTKVRNSKFHLVKYK